MTPPSPGVFSPPITVANMSTYFIDGFVNIGTVPVISGNSTVCEGSTGNVYTTQPGMTNYAWSVSAGGTITAGGTYLDNTVTVTWNTAGNQSVSVNFTSSGVTLPDPTVYPVTVNPSPPAAVNIAASPAGPVCTGTSVTFTAFPTNGGTPAYQWLKGGAVIPGATGPTYTSASLKNQDIISVRMTSSLSCVTGSPATSNAITMVVITSGKASVSIAASPSGAICSGTSVTFTATPVNGGTPAYQWFKGLLPITGATGPNYTSATLKTGDIIWVRMTSSLSCVTGNPARSNAIIMVVYQCNPIILKTKVTDIHCSGAKPGAIDLTVTGGKAPYTYLWSNGATSQDLTNIKTAGTYKVTVTDSNGKTAEASASVKVISGPDAVIMPPDYINPVCGDFGTNILKAAPDGNYNFTYKWTVTAAGWSIKGPDNSREIRFIASTGEATFTLKVTDEFGCEDIATYVMAGCNPENYCTYTKNFYGKKDGNACDPEGNPISPREIMIRAFGSGSSVTFGAQPGEKGFKFVLRINEVQSDFIFNMLPGGGNPNALKGNANSDPDRRTGWNYVPISTSRSSFGQIKNNLLVQTMTLIFNLSNEPALNQVRITGRYVGTVAARDCGSVYAEPATTKFTELPPSVLNYLKGKNTIADLYRLANLVLSGVNTKPAVSPSDITKALDAINSAFDGCRILTGFYDNMVFPDGIPPSGSGDPTDEEAIKSVGDQGLSYVNKDVSLRIYPNPFARAARFEIEMLSKERVRVEIYSQSGTLLQVILNENLGEGDLRTVEFDGSEYSNSAFLFRVTTGTGILNGTIMKAK